MTLVRSLVLACALAVPVTMTHAFMQDIPAEAAGKKGPKKAKAAKKGKAVAGKSCGEYKYLKGGKCQDARAKKGGES
ncbi:MAG: hypothetical protein R3D44_11875 [Hyphomicrobiaceae bacterium]